jgi:predicted transglutaminase-like cysteine proteinase
LSVQARSDPAIVETSPALAPFQHVRFCIRYPSECLPTHAKIDRIELDPKASDLLEDVNRSVNAAIAPLRKSYGSRLSESWTIAPKAGDCNDYAVTKRHQLLSRGFPAGALRLAVVLTPDDVGHLVLVISTTSGDLVLDNLTTRIRDWRTTDYKWLKIQSMNDAHLWYAIGTQTAVATSMPPSAQLRLASRR